MRAHALAVRARADIAGTPGARREDILQIERWLAGHPL
jgi:hypothetical protein